MTIQFKHQIKEKLAIYILQKGSQNKAANSLNGVTAGVLSQIMNDKWELISDAMWRNIDGQIDGQKDDWNIVETANLLMFKTLLTDAQNSSNVYGVISDTGTSKTETIKHFIANNERAYRLKCGDYWNKKYFLEQLIKTLGSNYSGFTVSEMIDEAVRIIKTQEKPIIIFDEFDKLSDQVLYFFITLYNELEDHCAIVVTATDHLEKRILKGVKNNRKGYREIYSRLGKRFIKLPGVNYTDVVSICLANGVEDRKKMKEIFDDCDGDLRRVKRKIHALKQR